VKALHNDVPPEPEEETVFDSAGGVPFDRQSMLAVQSEAAPDGQEGDVAKGLVQEGAAPENQPGSVAAGVQGGEAAPGKQPGDASDGDSSSSSSSDSDTPVPSTPAWRDQEDETASQMVYLTTFASVLDAAEGAPDASVPFLDVDTLTREQIRDAVLGAVANPVFEYARGGRPRKKKVKAVKLVVYLEGSANGKKHFHVALKLDGVSRWLEFKKALKEQSQLASHWSSTHNLFWSTVRYGAFTTERKRVVDDKPLVWTADGKPDPKDVAAVASWLYEQSQEPFNAKALKARREKREREAHAPSLPLDSSKKTKGDVETCKKAKRDVEKFTKIDFYALVVEQQLRNPSDVLAYAREKGSAVLRAFVIRHQRQLAELIEDVEQWEGAPAAAAKERQSDWELIQELARGTCECGGGVCQWWEAADDFFTRCHETIDRKAFAASLAQVISQGPGKHARVPLVVGATNAAKSTVLKPLVPTFGFSNVVHRPSEKASMALANIARRGKRFIFWDEYRPVEFAARSSVPVGTFLSLFGGMPLELQVSQSFHNGNAETRWRRGAAMTAKEEGLWDPIPAIPGLMPVSKEDIRHMQSRVRQFLAVAPILDAQVAEVPECKESFCRWLVIDAGQFATGTVERPMRRLRGRALPALPGSPDPSDGDDEDLLAASAVDYF
jgi:hypothetical protein